MRTTCSALLTAVALLATAACRSPSAPSAEPVSFGSTLSFGLCPPQSYCTSRLDVSAGEAVLTYQSRLQPPLIRRRAIDPVEWRRLVAALDAARLRALPSVIGCPDCADGGAETLTVVFTDGPSETVTFEYNQQVPGIELVMDQMRAIRLSLRGLCGDCTAP